MTNNQNYFFGEHIDGNMWATSYDITDPTISGADYSVEIKNITGAVIVTPQSSIDGSVWTDGAPMNFSSDGKQSGQILSEAYVRFKLEGADYDIIIVANPIPASGSGGSSDCPFNGAITIPADGTPVSGTTCEDFKDLFFASVPPTVDIRATNTPVKNTFDGNATSLPDSIGFGWYVTGSTIADAEVEGRPHLGANPAGSITNMDFEAVGSGVYSTTANPTVNAWNNDTTEFSNITSDQQMKITITDSEGRNASAADWFRFTLPYFGTVNTIGVLDVLPLASPSASYYQLDMVAESGSDKHTAHFPDSFGSLTGVQFYNTVSGAWEWMNGSQSGSLSLWDQTADTHTIDADSSVVNYTQFEHNGVLTGAVQLRFFL